MKIVISKVVYEYLTTIDNRTISITREDGAVANFHDDENVVNDWVDWMIENIHDVAFRG